MPLRLPHCRPFLPESISPRVALVLEQRQFRPFDRYLNDHLLVRPREDNQQDRSCKNPARTIVWILCSGWSLLLSLRANDCELTLAFVTRSDDALRSGDFRGALKSVDRHSPRNGRNVSRLRELKRASGAFVRRIVSRGISKFPFALIKNKKKRMKKNTERYKKNFVRIPSVLESFSCKNEHSFEGGIPASTVYTISAVPLCDLTNYFSFRTSGS